MNGGFGCLHTECVGGGWMVGWVRWSLMGEGWLVDGAWVGSASFKTIRGYSANKQLSYPSFSKKGGGTSVKSKRKITGLISKSIKKTFPLLMTLKTSTH